MREDHTGARLQRFQGRAAAWSGKHQHIQPGCDPECQCAGGLSWPRPLCGAQKDPRGPSLPGPARIRKTLPPSRPEIRPHGRNRRTDAHRPMVHEHGIPGEAGPQCRCGRGRPVLSGPLDRRLQPLAGKHPGLVHFAPTLVGASDSCMVWNLRRIVCREKRGRSPGQGRPTGLQRPDYPRQRCSRHVVLLGAGSLHLAGMASGKQ